MPYALSHFSIVETCVHPGELVRAAMTDWFGATAFGPGAGRLAGAGFVRGPARVPTGLGIFGR